MILTTIFATASDPTDPTVAFERLYRQTKDANLGFNEDDYRFHCDICNTHVLKNTKHCQ